MKKLICLALALMFFCACKKDGDKYLRTETIIVASEKRIAGWGDGFYPTLVVMPPEGEWEFFYNDIEGFDWEQGYECELRVRVYERYEDSDRPTADRPMYRYVLDKVVSKTRKYSEGLPSDLLPPPEN